MFAKKNGGGKKKTIDERAVGEAKCGVRGRIDELVSAGFSRLNVRPVTSGFKPVQAMEKVRGHFCSTRRVAKGPLAGKSVSDPGPGVVPCQRERGRACALLPHRFNIPATMVFFPPDVSPFAVPVENVV